MLFFKDLSDPEELADEVLDRMIHKAAQEEIENKLRYAFGVARYVKLEYVQKTRVLSSYEGINIELREEVDSSEPETRLQILDECLKELPRDDWELILAYYQHDKVKKIQLRRKLAAERGMSVSSLRVRAHRIRSVLEKKIKRKMERYKELADY